MAPRKRNPNGAGSIWQRKDGRFEARVYVPQPDGTRKRKTVYGSTWEECDEKRQELVRRDRQGIPTPSRSAKLSEWLPYWLEEYIRPNRKRTTYVKYEMHVRLYLVPLLGSRRLESLTTTNVRHMISKVTAQSSAATSKEAHRVLRTAITAACRDELISRNVVQLVPAPRVAGTPSLVARRNPRLPAGPGTRAITCSRPAAAGRSSPVTSTARSYGSRNPRTCRRYASTTRGTAARHCSSRPASRPGPSWRSSVTRRSR